ncbi:MAG: hypothetical protein Q9174_006275, partial [Haloplaca sp. 1 TL-2023]
PPPLSATSISYTVPNSNVRISLAIFQDDPRPMPLASVSTLLSTAIDNLDRLAAAHGGPKAVVTPSLVEWMNSGLEIDMAAGPDQSLDRGGGPCRFEELRAAYEGVAAVIARLGYRECTIIVERLSSVLRRRVRLIAGGQMTFVRSVPTGNVGVGNGTACAVES